MWGSLGGGGWGGESNTYSGGGAIMYARKMQMTVGRGGGGARGEVRGGCDVEYITKR